MSLTLTQLRLSFANAHTVEECLQRFSGSLTLTEVRWFANACRALTETIMLAECSQRFSGPLTLTEVQWFVNAHRGSVARQRSQGSRRGSVCVKCEVVGTVA